MRCSDRWIKGGFEQIWNIENINSIDTCVTHQFEKDIVIKLPFKPDHAVVPDNFRVCEKRLRNLKKNSVHENLMIITEYEIAEYERKQIIGEVPEEGI